MERATETKDLAMTLVTMRRRQRDGFISHIQHLAAICASQGFAFYELLEEALPGARPQRPR
jgi:hypothetical protein